MKGLTGKGDEAADSSMKAQLSVVSGHTQLSRAHAHTEISNEST